MRGTCYFEFLPGKYKRECWQKNSVFLDEQIFELIEDIFKKRIKEYDHFSFVEINKEDWGKIMLDLKKMEIQDPKLKIVVADLIDWLKETINKEEVISLLGL